MEFLQQSLGPLTLLQWLGIAAAAVALSSVAGALNSRNKATPKGATVPARCLSCNWKGQVSKYHRTCPKCGMSITKLSRKEE